MMKKSLEEDILLRMQFYSQYLFQYVVELPTQVWTGNPPEPSHDELDIQLFEPEVLRKVVENKFPLMLRAIEDITDKEAIEVAKLAYTSADYRVDRESEDGIEVYTKNDRHRIVIFDDYSGFCVERNGTETPWLLETKISHDQSLFMWQYLNSISVATPFMGHTVEELIEAGWIKLIEP